MGILRADRVTHSSLEPTGSVLFDGTTDMLTIPSHNALAFGTADWSVEGWFYFTDLTGQQTIVGDTYGATAGWYLYKQSNHRLGVYYSSLIVDGVTELEANRWYHLAFIRNSGVTSIYIDGVLDKSATDTTDATITQYYIADTAGTSSGEFFGYISNLRITRTAVYKQNFTVPKFELKNIPGTILLCCQSSSSTTESAVSVPGTLTAQGDPTATSFTPDIRKDITDIGPVFADNTKFDTLSYMVPPGGKTTDRYLKSTGDIVSDNLIWHIDAGNTTSYAGVTTSGTTIYDLKAGSGMNGTVGIATLASGHADFPAPGWTPDNGGAWYLASDSNLASPSNTGQFIEMPYVNLGNDNYTINAWVKLQYYSEQSDGLSYIVSNKDGSPVSYHAHIKEVGGNGRIGGGAYYTGWTYDYASSDSENTMIALNEWYMLTWVNTAQYTQSMYVNGVIQKLNGGAYTWNSRSSNNTPVNATSYASNETTNAWIGQIQYYSDTLTAAEILQNYNAHKCRYDQ